MSRHTTYTGGAWFGAKESLKVSIGNLLLRYTGGHPDRDDRLRRNPLLGQLIRKAEDFNRCTLIRTEGDEDIGAFSVLLRHHTSDYKVYNQVLLEKEYKELADCVSRHVPGESVRYVLDAGGNIGLTTLYLKKRFPRARVVTIEPDAKNFSLLQRNVHLNRLEGVSFLKAGLWGKAEVLDIDRGFRDGKEWSVALTAAGEGRGEAAGLPGVTVEDVLRRYGFSHLDVLKIDIEGAERFVFADNGHVRRFLAKVRFIAIEIHDEFNVREQILRQLTENHFDYFHHGELTIGVNTRFTEKNG
ncbi:MAG TPA: FkbM family methyltransferase [Cytophagales bacterium]|jgi:FkbM family methyltransferase